MHDGAVAGAVVGHHPLDLDPVAAEEGEGAAQEAGGGRAFLVVEHLDVGEPGRVVDGDVHELPADPARLRAPVAVDAVAGPADPAELLDVDVDELAGPGPLVAVGRLVRLQPRQLSEPVPGQYGADGRERHPQRLGDLGLVKRNSRSDTISSSRSAGVREGTERGAEERSASPASPSRR